MRGELTSANANGTLVGAAMLQGWGNKKTPLLDHPGTLNNHYLGGGFKDFLFSPLLGEVLQFD